MRLKHYYSCSYISKFKRNFPIHSAFLKYGYSNFKLEILEYCDKYVLADREQHYMYLIKPQYNNLTVARSNFGFKHSETTKKLFSLTRLGRVFSETTKLKLSLNNHRSIPVNLINIKTGTNNKFNSKNKAAQFLGVSETTIRKCIIHKKPCKGHIITPDLKTCF